ncbi:hypothetical protein [Paenibacillus luteus]|uniref:hypothetical protein n=1 Tax=Paenibacillus luteus TaxID=2545753 RepID=UPI0011413A47|nr:hypothetical protein [Paenibacillus luteus]
MEAKKRPGCLKILLIVVGIFIAIIIVIGVLGSIFGDTTTDSDNGSSTTSTQGSGSSKSQDQEDLYAEAQELFKKGSYIEANIAIDKAIKVESKEEYTKLKTEIKTKIDNRKAELEAMFEIKDDKVENITFISPKEGVSKGLVFYPYIGVKDSNKYMVLRVGYQEPASKALFVFTGIKVRAGEVLEELKFNPMNKLNNVDILGSGMTELIDLDVNKKNENLLSTVIPSTEEVIIRFEDISNKSTDYTLTKEQKQTIADILEYYNYLD